MTQKKIAKDHNSRKIIHFWVPNLFDFKGGIQVYLRDVLFGFKQIMHQDFSIEEKFDVVVLNKLDHQENNGHLEFENFLFVFNDKSPKKLETLFFSWKLLKFSLMYRPSLIFCGHVNFSPIAHLINCILGTPYWVFVYGVDAWNIKSLLKQRSLRASDKIISISEYTRRQLIEAQGIRAEDILLLPVSFDIDKFQLNSKPQYLLDRHNLKESQPIILTVARLDSEERCKGYDQILKVLPKIRSHIPNVHYMLVGKGRDQRRIENLVRTSGLDDCVTLTGFVPDEEICDYYSLCDVFAMPSKGEGFGIVYLEALACGKPVLGGNQDGATDALCNGELGVLVDPDNIDEIANALIEILQGRSSHPILYRPEILRQRVDEIYGPKKFKANLLALLRESSLAVL